MIGKPPVKPPAGNFSLEERKWREAITTALHYIYPVGAPIPWPSNTIPSGFLLFDGSAVPADCPALKAVYGANLPDLRGRYIFGKAASGTGATIQGTFGTKDMTMTVPAHRHPHSHAIGVANGLGGSTPQVDNTNFHVDGNNQLKTWLTEEWTGSGENGNAAMTIGGTSSQNPPSYVCNWITRAG